ncbi:uncharacterized protein LOC114543993 [Dendronephthya gigantea]|uniref:uncharacterized protein LOC114543993 n=1 Tax=Dendronephthya gigantea TaxID=151771 RepID=UPI00106B0524|nr:uncharacterized protein LOC114543993 [Dendronephthya gigantea]
MSAENCTDEFPIPPRILGDNTAVRVVLWVISTLALVSNLALIGTWIYTHARRQKSLSIFIVGLALSNLFVTSSVLTLLVADSHQSPRDETSALGEGNWSQSVCSSVYFLKHFGIYSFVITLTLIILERFSKLGYKLCIAADISFRRSVVYTAEAWVLSFLLIIPPWTRVTTWHKFCMANYEMLFAQVMYIICGLLVLGVCCSILMQVCLLFWRRILTQNSGTRNKETRTDIRLVIAGVVTFVMMGIPHCSVAILQISKKETGTEVVTILLAIACLLQSLIFIHYSPSAIRLSDTLSTKNMECTCGKCNVEQFYCTKYSLDSLNPPKSPDTYAEYEDEYESQRPFPKAKTTEHVSADSLLDLDTWTSRSTKTKSWIESCDYEDLRKIRTQPWVQCSRQGSSFQEITRKPRALTWSDKYGGKSTSTSGVNDVSSVTSSSSERASSISNRARSSSERERSSSDRTPSVGVVTKENTMVRIEPELLTVEHEVATTEHEADDEKTCEHKRRSKRLSSLRGLIQRALSPKRQRSKSLPEKTEECVKKFERSQSAPFAEITLEKTAKLNNILTIEIPPESKNMGPECANEKTGESTYMDRLASFFILAPAKSPKHPRKPTFSPSKSKPVGVSSPTPSQKSSMAERLVKSLSIGRKSPSHEPASPGKTIALEAGDILTELPVMRRHKLRTKPRDAMARMSTASTGSTGSAATRYSMEWDPIGSVEGYAEREVLPPYPPIKTHNGHPPVNVSRPVPSVQLPEQPKSTERTSLYSLDWDPTSVQLRNSVVSRDSLGSLGDLSDDEGQMYDIEDCEGSKGKTVWV